MPPKEFKCEICGEIVTKPKSYAYGKGRACRKHQEAQDAHQKSEQSKKDNIKKSTEKLHIRREVSEPRSFEELTQLRCWSCYTPAITEKQMFFEILKRGHISKKMGHIPNPFDYNNVVYKGLREDLKKEGKTIVCMYHTKEQFQAIKRRRMIHPKLVSTFMFFVNSTDMGIVPICPTCQEKNSLKHPLEDKPMPKMDLVDMAVMGSMVDKMFDDMYGKETIEALKNQSVS